MLIPESIQDCVCFMYAVRSGEMVPIGTAFFMSTEFSETGEGNTIMPDNYLVTALHVIAAAETRADDRCVHLRINTRSGGSSFLTIPVDHWVKASQDEEAIDVAVVQWQPYAWDLGLETLEWASIQTRTCAPPEAIGTEIGPGTDLFLLGLFVNHIGRERNVPIVRTGAVATLPGELVASNMGLMSAYLIEARSIGGLSGAPVFAAIEPYHSQGDRIVPREGARAWYLVGLMHGHWDADGTESTVDAAFPNERLNLGIAIVTPIQKVLELIVRPAASA